MTEITQLIHTIKYQLKQKGKTYRDLALHLGLSEASIKRQLANTSETQISLERVIEISHFLGFSLMELAQEASIAQAKITTLSIAQEKKILADTELLLITVCAINHWTIQDIMAVYAITEAICIKKLIQLERLQLITLLPGNRIRLNISRDFDWLPTGPLRQYFREHGMPDFLNAHF
ncbi:MAG: helix-turn-helix domain-containing protein, partial [Undibacterium sp.]|nr:helix-turn-helix domain-containing protein [Undibacterium sp.]